MITRINTKIRAGVQEYETINEKGNCHSENDEPSVVERSMYALGDSKALYKAWYKDGVKHRETGPAVMWEDNPIKDSYYLEGKKFDKKSWEREVLKIQRNRVIDSLTPEERKGIAKGGYVEKKDGNIFYFNKKGQKHRNADFPAVCGNPTVSWWKNGVKTKSKTTTANYNTITYFDSDGNWHREEGPALVENDYITGKTTEIYSLNGTILPKSEWEKQTNKKAEMVEETKEEFDAKIKNMNQAKEDKWKKDFTAEELRGLEPGGSIERGKDYLRYRNAEGLESRGEGLPSFHYINSPAFTYLVNGKLHCLDGPADFNGIGNNDWWYINGVKYKTAKEYWKAAFKIRYPELTDEEREGIVPYGKVEKRIDGSIHYLNKNNKYERDFDLPAFIRYDKTKFWVDEQGFVSRDRKPSIIYPTGEAEFFDWREGKWSRYIEELVKKENYSKPSLKSQFLSEAHSATYRIAARKVNELIFTMLKKQFANNKFSQKEQNVLTNILLSPFGQAAISMMAGHILDQLPQTKYTRHIERMGEEFRAESFCILTKEISDLFLQILSSITTSSKEEQEEVILTETLVHNQFA